MTTPGTATPTAAATTSSPSSSSPSPSPASSRSSTRSPAPSRYALLAAQVTALEADVYLEQIRLGIIPLGARRLATPAELEARVLFADRDDAHRRRVGRLMATAAGVRASALDALADRAVTIAASAGTGADVAAELARLSSSFDRATLGDEVAEAITGARDVIRAELEAAADEATAELLDEAAEQGVPDAFLNRAPLTADDYATLDTAADRLARQPAEHLLTVAADYSAAPAIAAGDPTDAAYGALDAAEQASTRATEDVARQAATTGSGTGRRLGIAGVTAQPARIYASELLDKNTCSACGVVDGTEYASLADALAAYPNAEGYIGCAGGGRCRGTLVIVWQTEEPPTVGPPPAPPPDMTPPGPGRPGPPPTGPSPSGPAVLSPEFDADEVARRRAERAATTGPAPTPPPAPAVDTELLAMTDAEVEAAMLRAIDTGDIDAAERFALEADYRADWSTANPLDEADFYGNLTRPYDYRLDPRATPAQVADIDAAAAAEARAASEHYDQLTSAGIDVDTFTVSAPGTPAAGRRIDRLRVEYDDHVYQQYLAAEDVTRGTLIRADRYDEFVAKYGPDSVALFSGPARQAYYYASRELRDYWETHPRLAFEEFAEAAGVRSAKIRQRAEASRQSRESARRLAEEDVELRRARRNNRRPRRPLTEGERLERDRARQARERRRIEQAGGTIEPDTT